MTHVETGKMMKQLYADRPKPLTKGAVQEFKVKVQHRSDFLIQEQIENLQNLQDALQEILSDLQKATASEEVAFYKDQVERLWAQLEEAFIILQIVYKYNTELCYARQELQRALRKDSNSSAVKDARKRVGWLEDRMENALGKKKPQRPANVSTVHGRPFHQDQDTFMTQTSDGLCGQDRSLVYADNTQPDIKSGSMIAGQVNDEVKSGADKVTDDNVADTDDVLQKNNENVGTRNTSLLSASMRQFSSMNKENKVTIQVPEDHNANEIEPVLMTEVLIEPRRPMGSSTPRPGLMNLLAVKAEQRGPTDNEEVGYWESEHHRFYHHPESEAICQINPFSYHQMGLAVPGTFVGPIHSNPDLPWNNVKTMNTNLPRDPQHLALQKISERIHVLYERINEAAMFSVTGQQQEKISLRALLGLALFTQNSKSAKPSIAKVLKSQHSKLGTTKSTTSLPDLKNRIGSSNSGRLVYYPKPLPYPANLPITRTNKSEEFPRDSGVFNSTDMSRRPPAQRIVKQGKLYEETKFTSSLFRPKPTQNLKDNDYTLHDDTPMSRDSGKKKITFKTAVGVTKAMMSFKGNTSYTWSEMKPKSGALDHSGLKWERVKEIVHRSLVSPYVEERIDAARHLGVLKGGDTMVTYALKESLKHDVEARVQYEAAKSLVTLGCWEEDVLAAIVRFMIDGNQDIRSDLVTTMLNAKNVMFIDKKLGSFAEVAKILSLLCLNESADDKLSLDAAICLGKMCIPDRHACDRLLQALTHDHDSCIKAQALEILVRQINYHTSVLLPHILHQMKESSHWKLRKAAAKLILSLGKADKLNDSESELVYQECELALWNDPIKEVRWEVSRALAAHNMYARACINNEKRLEDLQEEIRAQGVISLTSLGVKNERIVRKLVEMLELDHSEYVRILIMKMFTSLNIHEKKVIRALREKEKGDGPLARSARKALHELGFKPVPSSGKGKNKVSTGMSLDIVASRATVSNC